MTEGTGKEPIGRRADFRVSARRVVFRDGWALGFAGMGFCWLAGSVLFAVLWGVGQVRESPSSSLWWMLSFWVAIWGVLLFWRIRVVRSTLRLGFVTRGKIERLPLTLRLPMIYSYSWTGREHRKYVFLSSREWLKRFDRKTRPRVVVDPKHQRRAFLADLFS